MVITAKRMPDGEYASPDGLLGARDLVFLARSATAGTSYSNPLAPAAPGRTFMKLGMHGNALPARVPRDAVLNTGVQLVIAGRDDVTRAVRGIGAADGAALHFALDRIVSDPFTVETDKSGRPVLRQVNGSTITDADCSPAVDKAVNTLNELTAGTRVARTP